MDRKLKGTVESGPGKAPITILENITKGLMETKGVVVALEPRICPQVKFGTLERTILIFELNTSKSSD